MQSKKRILCGKFKTFPVCQSLALAPRNKSGPHTAADYRKKTKKGFFAKGPFFSCRLYLLIFVLFYIFHCFFFAFSRETLLLIRAFIMHQLVSRAEKALDLNKEYPYPVNYLFSLYRKLFRKKYLTVIFSEKIPTKNLYIWKLISFVDILCSF